MRSILCALALAGLLGGCSLFDDEEILEGERVRIRAAQSGSDVISAPDGGIAIPGPRTNADWTQTNALETHAAGHLSGPSSLSLAWQVDAGAGGVADQITGAPIVVDGVVYVLDARSSVAALDAGTGQRRWQVSLVPEGEGAGDGFGGGLAYTNGRVIATTGFGEVIALDPADGTRLWTHAERAPFRAPPAAADGLVVAVTRDNRAVALTASDGEPVWDVQGIGAGASHLGGASPALGGPLAIIPFSSGEIVAVTRAAGRRAWSAVLGGPRRGQARSAIADVTGDPIIAGRIVVAGNQAGRMIAIDAQTGRRGWTRSIGSAGPIWAAGTSIYVLGDDSALLRMDIRTGETQWRTPLPAYEDPEDREDPIAYSGPVLAGGQVLITSTTGALLSFDPETGAAGAVATLPAGTANGVVVANGTLYVLSDDGTLSAFR